MTENDFTAFSDFLSDVYGLYPQAKPLTAPQVAMFFRAMSEHPLDAVRAAFDGHARDPQRGRFPPLPADLIAQLQTAAEDDGRPDAEEAWALSLAAADERATVVWTDEAAQAWAAARPVLAIGDEVGARMAFREVYAKRLAAARRERVSVRWWASLGWDEAARRDAIEQAVSAGRLPASELRALPAPPRDDAALLRLAGQAKGEPQGAATPAAQRARQRLREWADAMRGADEAIRIDTGERDRMDALKALATQRVNGHGADVEARR
jgi:hypothetical protein